jgi:kinesin family protein 5
LAREDLASARLYLAQAADLGTADPDLAEEIGAALAEVGPPAAAVAALERAIALRPHAGHAKYMYLGQVLGGAAGVAALRRGVALLEKKADAAGAAAAAAAAAAKGGEGAAAAAATEASAALAAGLCATAEAVLATAGPDAGGAEVEALFGRAAQLDPSSPEPWQGLASLRVEQGRPGEARAALANATSKWLPNLRAMMAALRVDSDGDEEGEEGEDPAAAAQRVAAAVAEIEARGGAGGGGGEPGPSSTADVEDGDDDGAAPPYDPAPLPPFEVRFEAAKLLLELEDSTADAVVVCESLVAEADLSADAWYLLALALAAGGDGPGALDAAAAGRAALVDPRAPPADADGAAFDDVEAAARELK